MEAGKMVLVNFTGRVVASNAIFETTEEKKAIEAGAFDQHKKYAPELIVVGSGEMLKPLEEALGKMNIGEGKKIVLKPQEAFGERNQKLIGIVPLHDFQERKINPSPGLMIEMNDRVGKVQSVSGGRVRVDFNHPLAGKEVEFELKIEKELKGTEEKIQGLFEKFFGVIPESEKKLLIKEDRVEISLDPKYAQAVAPVKKAFSEIITKNVKGITSVKFTEEFKAEKPKESSEEKEKQSAKKKAKKQE